MSQHADVQSSDGAAKYACGVRLHGLIDDLPQLAGGGPADWPLVRLSNADQAPAPGLSSTLASSAAKLVLGTRVLTVDRQPPGARLLEAKSGFDADLWLHTLVPMIGGVFAHWAGGVILHAGAAVIGGRAWALLGSGSRGKSTTLARLAALGRPVLSEDLLVIARGQAFAGPRVLYLRSDAPSRLGLGPADWTPARGRARISLASAPAQAPLGGLVVLRPGPELVSRRLRPAERLDLLVRFNSLAFAGPPAADLLELVELPAYELRHPRRWDLLDAMCGQIEAVAAA
jgi:hypothetical protein